MLLNEKLASDLSIARRESLEWEIEHKRVEHELLQVQAVLARMIVGNPLATSADRAMVVTHARKRKPARVLQVRTLVDSGQNYRPNSNTMIVAKYDKRKEKSDYQKKIEQRKYDNVDIGDIEEGKKWLGIDLSFNPTSKIEEIHNLPNTNENNNFQMKKDMDIFSKLKKVDNDKVPISQDAWLENFKRLERKLDMIIEYIENLQNSLK